MKHNRSKYNYVLKIMDVKIWFDYTSYASWLCEEKKKIEEMVMWNRMRMKRPWRRQKWKEKRNEKWKNNEGWIKMGVKSLEWKTQKFTLRRLRIRSIFGCEHISFGESPRTTMHCMTVCQILTCILFHHWELMKWYNYIK